MGSDVSVPVEQLGKVVDTVEDAQGYSYINGQPTLVIQVVKQSKANTVAVVDWLPKRIDKINESLQGRPGNPHLIMFQDMAWYIRMNLADVKFTILQGVFLTILVVFLFLGSFRSTLITITALPVSLFGAFFLMNGVGFTLNMMTLLALSLAVGLLIDDAIVVRENIWRHIEKGVEPKKAAVEAAMEVGLAVVATSSVVIAVFMPISFLSGLVGQFFRQFGLTVCFAMAISLFEAMVMGPMLVGLLGEEKGEGLQPDRPPRPSFRPIPPEVRAIPGQPAGRLCGDHRLVPEAPVVDRPFGRGHLPHEPGSFALHEGRLQARR